MCRQNKSFKRRCLYIITAISLFIILNNTNRNTARTNSSKNLKHNKARKFVLKSGSCDLEDLDPFDQSAMDKVTLVTQPYKCLWKQSLTFVTGTAILFNETLLHGIYKNRIDTCWYQMISRPKSGPNVDNEIEFSEAIRVTKLKAVMPLSSFIYFYCLNSRGDVEYKQYHSIPLSPPGLIERKAVLEESHSEGTWFNVLLLGIDSLSRSNVARQMPKTLQYIMEEFGGVEMKGYTKVGDNTLVNVIPLLTGKYVSDAFPGRDAFNSNNAYFDDTPLHFVWTNYSQKGYYTAFTEDVTKIPIFQEMHSGFRVQPTDYYNRHFLLGMEREQSLHHGKCIGPKTAAEYSTDYIKDLIIQHKNDRFFFLPFTTRFTHEENANGAGYLDSIFLKLFKDLELRGVWKNTILIFFGDHGARYGKLPQTVIGRKEVRLPALYIALPANFKKAFPHLYKNLQNNSNRLTSPFDVHKTLGHILDLNSEPDKSGIGLSLLQNIPETRTCTEAGISPEWCMCNMYVEIDTSEMIVKQAATVIVSEINQRVKEDSQGDLCVELKLSTIVDAYLLQKTRREVGEITQAYRVSVRTEPGHAHFDAHLAHNEETKSMSVQGLITRQTRYHEQSHCVQHPITKLYCFCKDMLS